MWKPGKRPGEEQAHSNTASTPWPGPSPKQRLSSHVSFGCPRWARDQVWTWGTGSIGNKPDAVTMPWDHQCPQPALLREGPTGPQFCCQAQSPGLDQPFLHLLSPQLPDSDLSLVQITPLPWRMLQCPIYNGPMVLMLQWSTVLWAAGNRLPEGCWRRFNLSSRRSPLRPSGWGVVMTHPGESGSGKRVLTFIS